MTLKNELISFCHKVYAKEFVAATDGNLSVRAADGSFLVTASGICKGEVQPEHIIRAGKDGNVLYSGLKISTEFKMHLAIYFARPEVNAVVHCHPVFATALATAQLNPDQPVFPEVILGIGRIPLAKYATPSTNEVAESIQPFLHFANCILLENHGAISMGRTIGEAYYRMEKLEHAAKTFFYAEMASGAKKLSAESLHKLYTAAESTYHIDIHPA
ncbi:MAG: class II aldolase/adducin family protein, partial [Ignavibacteriales bacterium]|nr:class II aldolase/adducin family protein [Ignavibacteriales bacterium]